MDIYNPMMTNSELKTLCGLVSKEHKTPLRQARAAINTIQFHRSQYQPKVITPAEREFVNKVKRGMGVAPWKDF